MKFGVVIFPGSNCDRDVVHALQNELKQEVIQLWHKEKDISIFTTEDCIVLPGGFSYGDYLRCGAIAKFSPMMQSIIEFANRGGKVVGICNGFQILCESGLLPGVLLRNANMQFICKNVFIKNREGDVLKIPVAHGEGRYFANDEIIRQLQDNNQIMYRYCDEKGDIDELQNPNGSVNNIAGICNKEKNVIGMMPHPERACSKDLGNEDGKKVFEQSITINKVKSQVNTLRS